MESASEPDELLRLIPLIKRCVNKNDLTQLVPALQQLRKGYKKETEVISKLKGNPWNIHKVNNNDNDFKINRLLQSPLSDRLQFARAYTMKNCLKIIAVVTILPYGWYIFNFIIF